ncbi:MAG: hypothetical protein BJ554DRAFT_8079 [Olpidium bornovanus]|uniref:Uncharacterized protein n=1 Tax=Olpidium bornovanus TaxID=278681 RepID=A0A8H8DIK4_9FUNG|nr:MAG: hypothetical protein BJ554DRAFT_8079 [Olpidium bornovanus]
MSPRLFPSFAKKQRRRFWPACRGEEWHGANALSFAQLVALESETRTSRRAAWSTGCFPAMAGTPPSPHECDHFMAGPLLGLCRVSFLNAAAEPRHSDGRRSLRDGTL